MTQTSYSSAVSKRRLVSRSARSVEAPFARVDAFVRSTPGQIRIAIVGVWVLALTFAGVTWIALDRHRQDMQTVGKDSAPSVIAAESIKWNFADLHSQNIARFLGSSRTAADAAEASAQRRADVTQHLLAAAENITYGEAERTPIRNLLDGLSGYDEAIGQAIALQARHDGSHLKPLADAERLAHDKIIPAAEALDQANQSAMDNGYNQERAAADAATALMLGVGVILLAALAGIQLLLQSRTHRRISPGLVGSAIVTLLWAISMLSAMNAESRDLKTAKADAFDSIGVLWRARADAFSAQSHLALSLLAPQFTAPAEQAFDQETTRVAAVSNGTTFEQVQGVVNGGGTPPQDFSGYIAVELRNITFEGEQDAANQMLARYTRYLEVAGQVRHNRQLGQTDRAVGLCLGTDPDQARGALAGFDESLKQVLQINQQAFDASVNRGLGEVAGFDVMNIFAALAIAILAQLGLSQRLKEYRV